MAEKARPKKAYFKAVGPRLQKLLIVVFALFALLAVNSTYLAGVTIAGPQYQTWFYMLMFALHLVLGFIIILPVIVFGIVHMRNTRHRKNKRAIKVGYALFGFAILLLASGLVLTRLDVFGVRFEVNQAQARGIAYWAHVITPFLCIWLFVLHRLAGKKIKWRVGGRVAAFALAFAGVMLFIQTQDPRQWNSVGPASGEKYFFPSLARTATGDFIPAEVLANDDYCAECHTEIHASWSDSVHRFSSFNNPVYLFSVKETRAALMARDGNVHGSRFCAGCHDPVPFFSGAFDDPKFDDPEYDLAGDQFAQAGITCTSCHAITHINSPRGNSDFTIEEPLHYPFAFSDNPFLKWVNHQLVKAKPAFHKATFLKPLHKEPELCGSCHKVHLPPELNAYKWLRGQNHYDPFILSGVSGRGITSFYYPPKAQENCNGCHMPLIDTGTEPNFGARVRDDSGRAKTLDHRFPSANTAIAYLLADQFRDPEGTIQAHKDFNEGVMRVDIFGVKEGGTIDSPLIAPLRPEVPTLDPGTSYLFEAVVRTLKMGHIFTQGTADSNQVWLDVSATLNGETIGRSGAMDKRGEVDPWSHFINVFVLDREGNRINRRNAQDIFIPLYNNQIPPGAADSVHFRLDLPEGAEGVLEVSVKLRYRKFDREIMTFVEDDPDYVNDLPIMTMASDILRLPVGSGTVENPGELPPLWQRWNDYGIGLFRKGQLGHARQAWAEVEALGKAQGPLNIARAYIREGLVQADAPRALARAASMDPPADPWSLLWFGAVVAARNGDYDKVIANIEDLFRGGFKEAEGRGFDFSKDWRVQNFLADALYQKALASKGDARKTYLERAVSHYETTLSMDPEDLNAHWGMKQTLRLLGDVARSEEHASLHARYKPDDNARGRAVAAARRKYPAANHAAEAVVIYDLQRKGAYGLRGGDGP